MEYDNRTIDRVIEKKFKNCSSFKSKYKDLHKMTSNNEHECFLRNSNGHEAYNKKSEILDHIYNTPDEYEGFSFLTKEGFYDDGFSDNIQEGVTFEIPGIPGTPSTPGIPGSTTKGVKSGPYQRIKKHAYWDRGPCSCYQGCRGCAKICDKGCVRPAEWEEYYYTSADIWNPGTNPIPGLPGLPGVKFDVPSISDMYNQMKNKIDSEVIEPFSGYRTETFDDIHETLQHMFQDNAKEILAVIVFCIIWILSTTLTENRLIILLLSSFVASLFYICIRDLNGILYTLEKPNNVISEALK